MIKKLSYEEYDSIDALRATSLKILANDTRERLAATTYTKPSSVRFDPLRFGKIIHAVVLQQKDILDELIIFPNSLNLRTKDGRAVRDEAHESGKLYCYMEEMDKAQEMYKALENWDNDEGKTILEVIRLSEKEMTITGKVNFKKCKGMLDVLNRKNGIIIDYKTCSSSNSQDFYHSAIKYGYDIQAALYIDIAKVNKINCESFIFVAQEKTFPYLASVFVAMSDGKFVEDGRNKYLSAMANTETQYDGTITDIDSII